MTGLLRYAVDLYELSVKYSDPRTKNLPLVQPTNVIVIIALYLTFIYKWGPQFMKNRPAFKIDKIIMVYNALQVIACGYLFVHASFIFFSSYKMFCQPVDRSNSSEAWVVTLLTYFYYLLKVADLLDTVFFVLRKKHSHITFLHVYHHAGMVLLIGGATNYIPGGHATSVGIINSLVHCIMYSYYFMTLYNPEYKKNIWWKKYVTQLQIVQFCIIILHMGSVLVIPNCDYPKFTFFLLVPQNIFMLMLFGDFYYKAYVKKRQEPNAYQTTTNEYETKNTNGTANVERIILSGSNESDLLSRNHVHRS